MLSGQDNRENQSKTVKFGMSDRALSRTDKQRHVRPCPEIMLKNATSQHEITWRGTNRHEAGTGKIKTFLNGNLPLEVIQ